MNIELQLPEIPRRMMMGVACLVIALGALFIPSGGGDAPDLQRPQEIVWQGPGGPSVEMVRPSRIIGGRVQGDPVPWFAQVTTEYGGSRGHCGGGVVSPHVVATAAHCLSDDNGRADFQSITLRIGSLQRDDPNAWTITAREAGVHYFYAPNAIGYTHDLAFICLPRAASDTLKAPVFPEPGDEVTVYGMGTDDSGSISSVLKAATLEVRDAANARLELVGVDGSYRPADSGGIAHMNGRAVSIVSTFVPLAGDPVKARLNMTPLASYPHLIQLAEKRCAARAAG